MSPLKTRDRLYSSHKKDITIPEWDLIMANIIILSRFAFKDNFYVNTLFLTTGIQVFLCIPKIANGKPIVTVI